MCAWSLGSRIDRLHKVSRNTRMRPLKRFLRAGRPHRGVGMLIAAGLASRPSSLSLDLSRFVDKGSNSLR